MSELNRRSFEFAFATACRKTGVKAAYIIFDNDSPANPHDVRVFTGGETTAAALLKQMVDAGQHAIAGDFDATTAEMRLNMLFASLNVDKTNTLLRDWHWLTGHLGRLRAAYRALKKLVELKALKEKIEDHTATDVERDIYNRDKEPAWREARGVVDLHDTALSVEVKNGN